MCPKGYPSQKSDLSLSMTSMLRVCAANKTHDIGTNVNVFLQVCAE